MPYVNGKSADAAVIGAVALMALLIVMTSLIVIDGKVVPDFLSALLTLLGGFLIGTRVVPSDTSRDIVEKVKNGKPVPREEKQE